MVSGEDGRVTKGMTMGTNLPRASRPRLTDRVLRGIVALAQPWICDEVNGSEDRDEDREWTHEERAQVEDARVALAWARAMQRHRSISARSPIGGAS